MVHVTTSKYSSLGDYLGGLTKKRRRNYRVAVRALKGQRIEIAHARKLKPQWADGVYGCLRKSAHQSDYFAPYQDVLSGRSAFLNQSQEYLVAEDRGEVVGFVTFIDTGGSLDADTWRFRLRSVNHIVCVPQLDVSHDRDCDSASTRGLSVSAP